MRYILLLTLTLTGCACPFLKKSTKAYPQNTAIQKITDDATKINFKAFRPKDMIIIVAEPKTGRILAMNGNSVGCLFEPASTLKPVITAAALQEGKVRPKTMIHCENGSFDWNGMIMRDYKPYGDLTVDEILETSSNIGHAKMGLMLDDRKFYEVIYRFGFGEKTGINIMGENAGLLNIPSRWDSQTKARMSIGQSLAVTPIQIAMAYCAIANGGTLMKPVIGDENPVRVRRVCSTKTANHLKNTLELTAKKTAPLARVDGIKVGGIPGTAQAITPDGKYASNKYWTMFAGFFPLENPKYVCLVVVNEANVKSEFNYGALVAAPIFSEIAKKIY
jgi:cell division protein FtsI/penicillin-binding protein 2